VVSLSALAAYTSFVTLGVLVPRLQMFADVVWRGPAGSRGVALTFDDGPHPIHTRAVLDRLDEAGAKATFFVVGRKASQHPDVVREIVRRGHLVGIHGDRHDRGLAFRTLATVRADLAKAISTVVETTGQRPALFRPAVGQTNPRIAQAATELDLTIVGWSIRARDGIRTRPERIIARVVPRLRDGSIVLLHDAAEYDDRVPAAPAALARILTAMHANRLPAVRVDAWVVK
jgi:peptidoglycan/xylan/chitin deacetylase (PgdA/CDA1 family)